MEVYKIKLTTDVPEPNKSEDRAGKIEDQPRKLCHFYKSLERKTGNMSHADCTVLDKHTS